MKRSWLCLGLVLSTACVDEAVEQAFEPSASAGTDTGATTGSSTEADDPATTTDDPSGGGSSTSPQTSRGESTGGVGETGGETETGGTTGGEVDPSCYVEPLDPGANIDDVVAAYGGADWKDDLIEAMDRRWPAGAYLLDQQRDDPYFAQFSNSSSWSGMVGWLDTLVHEQTHLFNAYHAIDQGQAHALYMREDLILYLPPDQGFPRSEILPHMVPEVAAGIYSDTYFTGQQGSRGFNALLDEANCYLNEVPGLSVFGEYFDGFGLSLRDGSAAFLHFIELYLRVARTDHPDFYDWAKQQDVYLDAVETIWLRTHFFYENVADMHPNLGIDDGMYREQAYLDENLAEIEMFLDQNLEPSSCLPQ